MNLVKDNKIMFKWSLVTAMLIAYFWIVYHFMAGCVPTTSFKVFGATWQFGISRWFDILIGPILTVIVFIIIQIFKKSDSRSPKPVPEYGDKEWYVALFLGLFLGVVADLSGLLSAVGLARGVSPNIWEAALVPLSLGCLTAFAIGHALKHCGFSEIIYVMGYALAISAFSFVDAGLSLCLFVGSAIGIGLIVDNYYMKDLRLHSILIFSLFYCIFTSLFLGLFACLAIILFDVLIFTLIFGVPALLKRKIRPVSIKCWLA